MGLPTRSTSAGINKPRIGVIRQGRGPTSVALSTEALAAQRKERNHVCRHDRKPAGPAATPPVAAAGFRVVAPGLRGYTLSSKPAGLAAYTADQLAADLRGLIRERGAESALLVGHDWGGTVAWATAMNHPEVVDRLAILNAAHPRRLNQGLRSPRQLLRSWYFFYFQPPGLPERRVRRRHWRVFPPFPPGAPPAFS